MDANLLHISYEGKRAEHFSGFGGGRERKRKKETQLTLSPSLDLPFKKKTLKKNTKKTRKTKNRKRPRGPLGRALRVHVHPLRLARDRARQAHLHRDRVRERRPRLAQRRSDVSRNDSGSAEQGEFFLPHPFFPSALSKKTQN